MTKVLVSGASGVVGYGILRSLALGNPDLFLMGSSIYSDSVANGFCSRFELAPPTSDKGYMPWLLQTINREKIDILFPGIDIDMKLWNENRDLFAGSGAVAVLNSEELIRLCNDKWIFYKTLSESSADYAIDSSLEADYDFLSERFSTPFLLKPRNGFGSKGIVRIASRDDFHTYQHKIGLSLFAQAYVGVDEQEFTAASFGDGAGGNYCMMCMRRRLSSDGFTEKAEVVESAEITEAVEKLSAVFKPLGPTNFQFRMHKDGVKLLEINPRVSSSTSIRAKFGYNECMMAVDFFLHNRNPVQPVIRKGRAVRYIEDFMFYS